jgi:hypothetical protein
MQHALMAVIAAWDAIAVRTAVVKWPNHTSEIDAHNGISWVLGLKCSCKDTVPRIQRYTCDGLWHGLLFEMHAARARLLVVLFPMLISQTCVCILRGD